MVNQTKTKRNPRSPLFVLAGLVLVGLYLLVLGAIIFTALELKFNLHNLGLLAIPLIGLLIFVLGLKSYLIYTLPVAIIVCIRLWIARHLVMFSLLSILTIGLAIEYRYPLLNAPNSELQGIFPAWQNAKNRSPAKYFSTPKRILAIQRFNILDLEDTISIYIPYSTSDDPSLEPIEFEDVEIENIEKYLKENMLMKFVTVTIDADRTKLLEEIQKGPDRVRVYRPNKIEVGGEILSLENLHKKASK